MDVNGTRFQLILGQADWERCALEDLAWHEGRHELTLRPGLFRFPTPAADRPPRPADRRGAARDRYGNTYWIDAARSGVDVHSAGSRRTTPFWSSAAPAGFQPAARHGGFGDVEAAPAPEPLELAGLALTEDHHLVAGVVRPPGLLVFDLIAGGAPTHLVWPAEPALEPADLATRHGGGVHLLDRENLRAWELDRTLRIVTRDARGASEERAGVFAPTDGCPPAEIAAAGALRVEAADARSLEGRPIAIEAAPGGGILILDEGPSTAASRVLLYRDGRPAPLAAELRDEALDLEVRAFDATLVPPPAGAPEHDLGTLWVADAQGNQSFAFSIAVAGDGLAADVLEAYYPMRLFGGRGLVADAERAYYDFEELWLPLVEQPRSRYAEAGAATTPPLDGREPGCVWHRVALDACLPPGTRLRLESRAADDEDGLAVAPFVPEPEARERSGGSELPWQPPAGPYTTYELLLQQARGRHLQLRLHLLGDGRSSPRLRALRAWYPRFSYLERYLPAVYREETESASFLERYLANPEGILTEIEDRIAGAEILADPAAAPVEALPWLASWLGLALDPRWDERRARLLIANAVRLYARRGTLGGVELALRLALDTEVDERTFAEVRPRRGARIVEAFRTRRTPGVVLGDPTAPDVPALGTRSERWSPEQGRAELDRRYSEALAAARGADPGPVSFPATAPAAPDEAVWRRTALDALGFVPGEPPADVATWRRFLARRYPNVAALNTAHGLERSRRLSSFGEAQLAAVLPEGGAALIDWFQFHATVLPIRRRAHAFSVMLPVPTRSREPVDLHARRELARRVVELEKPAHTVFDVRFFWSAFRVGEARLGLDTALEAGSRAAELLAPFVLGREHLGEAFTGGRPPAAEVRRPPPACEECHPPTEEAQ